jgi:CHAT domain-containing protein/tetratricopeptide (TPR) repeat protein
MINRRGSLRMTCLSGFVHCGYLLAILAVMVFSLTPESSYASGHGGGGGGGGHPHRGGGGGGFGFGLQLNINPMQGRGPAPSQEETGPAIPEISDPKDAPKAKRRAPVEVIPARKLVALKVAYLNELAMDIDKTLMELAQKDPSSAVKLYKNALAQAQKRRDVQGEMGAYENLGHVYYLTGQFQRGSDYYDRALKIARGLKNPEMEAVALRNLAAIHIAWADYDEAEDINQEALKIFTEKASVRGAQMTLNNIGVMEKNRGRFNQAALDYLRSIETNKETNGFQLTALNNLANLFATRGETGKALESFELSIELAKKIGDSRAEGESLLNIAKLQIETGDGKQALENSKKALETFYRVGSSPDWAKKVVGDICLDLGRTQEAESYLREADYDSSLGRLYLSKGDLDSAKKHYEQLMKTAEKAGNVDELFTAYTGLGKVYEAKKNYGQAVQYYSKAVDLTEEMRSNLLLSERQNFFAGRINGFSRFEPSKGLVRVTLKQDKASQSIYPSELTRARDFADTLAKKIDGDYFGVPEDVRKEEMNITDKIASLKMGMEAIPKDIDKQRVNEIKRQIKDAETEKSSFMKSLREKFRDYASVKYPAPVKLETAALTPVEHVLMFDVTSEGVGVRLLKGKKVVSGSFISWKPEELENDVLNFRKSIDGHNLRAFDVDLSSMLYKRLLEDPLSDVPEGSPVIIIPDGVLALLPFEALVMNGKATWKQGQWGDYPEGLQYVGDRNPLVYAQSLTALSLARGLEEKVKAKSKSRVLGNRILVMADPVFEATDPRVQGNNLPSRSVKSDSAQYPKLMVAVEEVDKGICKSIPRLQATEQLANNLVKLYGDSCDAYTGIEATKSRFLEQVALQKKNYGSIVMATHGDISNKEAWLLEPVLYLTMVPNKKDGLLTMSEVAGLKLDTDVAALTACKTGLGTHLAGEGVMSMGRAFQCAGAKTVLMSLWSVADQSSVMLMNQFFKNIKEGKNKPQAWQEAKTHIRKAGFEHPFFWAAFIMMGDPGSNVAPKAES